MVSGNSIYLLPVVYFGDSSDNSGFFMEMKEGRCKTKIKHGKIIFDATSCVNICVSGRIVGREQYQEGKGW